MANLAPAKPPSAGSAERGRILRGAMKDDAATDPIWQLAESAVREAFLLRSFLNYLESGMILPGRRWRGLE
jgi:hypothetical protein